MASRTPPRALLLRSYQVGFGDCFLLTFRYPKDVERHVLIDFGSTKHPDHYDEGLMVEIAQDIKKQCKEKLHAIVVTHRHADHISGFGTSKGRGSGDIIASCKPDVIVQPWTEDPDAQVDAETATKPVAGGRRGFIRALEGMHAISLFARNESKRLAGELGTAVDQLSFLGENNLKNLSAIENLQGMCLKKDHTYVNFGSKSGLEKVLPGVKTLVIGPPNLKQSSKIRTQRDKDNGEFWQLHASTAHHGRDLRTGTTSPLFERQFRQSKRTYPAQWLVSRMKTSHAEQLLGLVRILDSAMNNTSVILLFTVGTKLLLFPGDAQIENWSYALGQEKIRTLLEKVTLYKVGHHGSLNATPKSLWNVFAKRSTSVSPGRLQSIVSTLAGKHGHEESDTEVPRRTLVTALKSETNYFSTQELTDGLLRKDFLIEF